MKYLKLALILTMNSITTIRWTQTRISATQTQALFDPPTNCQSLLLVMHHMIVIDSKKNTDHLEPLHSLSVTEYYEQDEILKLRQAALKKEDTDLQVITFCPLLNSM